MSTADELAKAEAEVFGANPVRGADGKPLEVGHGSDFQKASPEAKKRWQELVDLKASEDKVAELERDLAAEKTKLLAQQLALGVAPRELKPEPKPAAEEPAALESTET